MSIIREARGITDQEAAEFFEGTILERYATDIFE